MKTLTKKRLTVVLGVILVFLFLVPALALALVYRLLNVLRDLLNVPLGIYTEIFQGIIDMANDLKKDAVHR